MREACPDRLDLARVFGAQGGQRHPAGHQHAGQMAHRSQGHHHRREPLVAGRHADHAGTRGQRADQPPQHLGSVVPVRQRVHHARRALGAAVARVAAESGEGYGAAGAELQRCLAHEEADFEVARVVPEGDRRTVLVADAALRAENEVLVASQVLRVPTHSGVLRPAEDVAAGTRPQHGRRQGQSPGRPLRSGSDVIDRSVVRAKAGVHRLPVWRMPSHCRPQPPQRTADPAPSSWRQGARETPARVGRGWFARPTPVRHTKPMMRTGLRLLLYLATATAGAAPPNLVLIMVDDLGPEWISSYGGEGIETPNIDKLAQGGLLFRNAYSMPQCTPTRVTLLTGQYPFRHGWDQPLGRAPLGRRMPLRSPAQRPHSPASSARRDMRQPLRANGRSTISACSPKPSSSTASTSGRSGPEAKAATRSATSAIGTPTSMRHRSRAASTRDAFGPDLYNAFLVDFVQRHRDRPMLLYYPMALTHGPLVRTPARALGGDPAGEAQGDGPLHGLSGRPAGAGP